MFCATGSKRQRPVFVMFSNILLARIVNVAPVSTSKLHGAMSTSALIKKTRLYTDCSVLYSGRIRLCIMTFVLELGFAMFTCFRWTAFFWVCSWFDLIKQSLILCLRLPQWWHLKGKPMTCPVSVSFDLSDPLLADNFDILFSRSLMDCWISWRGYIFSAFTLMLLCAEDVFVSTTSFVAPRANPTSCLLFRLLILQNLSKI